MPFCSHILFITLLWATRLTGEHTGGVSNRKFIFSGNRYREAKSPGDNIGFRKCRSLVDTCHSSCQNEAEKLRTVWALSTSCRQLTREKEPHRLTWATSGRHFLVRRSRYTIPVGHRSWAQNLAQRVATLSRATEAR